MLRICLCYNFRSPPTFCRVINSDLAVITSLHLSQYFFSCSICMTSSFSITSGMSSTIRSLVLSSGSRSLKSFPQKPQCSTVAFSVRLALIFLERLPTPSRVFSCPLHFSLPSFPSGYFDDGLFASVRCDVHKIFVIAVDQRLRPAGAT